MAEKIVLTATSSTLRTCAIRPHLIWGPGDPHLIPRLIERGKARALKIVGSGKNLVDLTFIENVAHAHILAAKSLNSSAVAAGNPYFIGQERPVNLWNWINELYQELGIPVITARIPFRLAYTIGAVLEFGHLLLNRSQEPRMTRFLAEQLARNHYFSHVNATRDLGYKPIISLEEGHKRLISWLGTRV
jgi:nucleoside-diphosphate-sugar epimerase